MNLNTLIILMVLFINAYCSDNNRINNGMLSTTLNKTFAAFDERLCDKDRIQLEELGYNSEEVNNINPKIALKVIERLLPRPVNGMPVEWRQKSTFSSRLLTKLGVAASKTGLVTIKLINKAWEESNRVISPMLPAVVVIGVLMYDRDNLSIIVEKAWMKRLGLFSKLRSLASSSAVKEQIGYDALRWNRMWRRRRPPVKDSQELDTDAFLDAQHQTLWTKFAVRAKQIKKN